MLNGFSLTMIGIILLIVPYVPAQVKPSPPPSVTPREVHKMYLGRVLRLVNIERRQAGVPALHWSAKLAEIGQIHAEDMARRNYFSDYSPEGMGPAERATKHNYPWTAIGENIAIDQTSSDQVMQNWMASPEYRANILDPSFTQMGVGYKVNSAGRPLWVQVFGAMAK